MSDDKSQTADTSESQASAEAPTGEVAADEASASQAGKWINERREKDGTCDIGLPSQYWGLALSGGGIRSATFCFGLLKALSKNGVFRRFDLLSTVSGGGYVGSTVGRLFHESKGSPKDVEKALAGAETEPFGVWLRSNGRYLIPRGTKDLIFAGANYGRNLLAIHLELAVLALLLGGLLVGIDLAVWGWADCIFRDANKTQAGTCWQPAWANLKLLRWIAGPPPVWLLLPLVAWISVVLGAAYWAVPQPASFRRIAQLIAATALSVVGGALLLRHAFGLPDFLPLLTGTLQLPIKVVAPALALLTAWLVALLLAALMGVWLAFRPKDADQLRHLLTSALAKMLWAGLGIGLLGAADYLAWSVGNFHVAEQGTFGVVLAVVAVALRAALPKVADLPKSLTPGAKRTVMELLNIAGLVLLALVVVFWIGWVHRATSDLLFVSNPARLKFNPAKEVLLWLVVPPLFYAGVSLWSRDFLNRSSLFTFYRARLVRSYLGAGNAARFVAGGRAKTPADLIKTEVADVHKSDDVSMENYKPHTKGGPVHLLNVCINQTRDPRGGLFNQDRKGLLLTVGPEGHSRKSGDDWESPAEESRLTLGSWMAISGAAIAPGLGASTRSGISSILMLAGLRLGYWWDTFNFLQKTQRTITGRTRRFFESVSNLYSRLKAVKHSWKLFEFIVWLVERAKGRTPAVGKYPQFLSELRGRFDGDRARDWYLSDGGHFENTGAYALLREECGVIVLADCGADPRYSFGDLENLVRKARIDLQAEITFMRPKTVEDFLKQVPPSTEKPHISVASYGSLNDLASGDSQACLALAKVKYRSGQKGHLLIVKPNMCQGVPVDLVNFKADNPLFPQEPTTDQFFSEAQWESYFQLGQTLGEKVQAEQLKDLKAFETEHFTVDDGAMLVKDDKGKESLKYTSNRLSSRILATGAVSATVSLGAVTTIGLAAWEAVTKELSARSLASKIEPATFKELSAIFGKMPPDVNVAAAQDTKLGEMATELLRVGHAVCTPQNLAAFRKSELMTLMLVTTKKACRDAKLSHDSCKKLLDVDVAPSCLQNEPRAVCVPTYGTRDYTVDTTKQANCWTPPKPIERKPASSQGGVCDGKEIFVQIYGPDLRDYVSFLRTSWRALGASVPPVEDVWDTARRVGKRAPQPYAVPTVIYQDKGSEACAKALLPDGASPAWRAVQAADGSLSDRPDAIQVWIPPYTALNNQEPTQAYCFQRATGTRYKVQCHSTLEACDAAALVSAKSRQTACSRTALTGDAGALFRRGWDKSWVLERATAFDEPYPQLPEAPAPAPVKPPAPK